MRLEVGDWGLNLASILDAINKKPFVRYLLDIKNPDAARMMKELICFQVELMATLHYSDNKERINRAYQKILKVFREQGIDESVAEDIYNDMIRR